MVDLLAGEALAAYITPVEIMELQKIGAPGIPQLTEVNISKTDRTGVAKISKTGRTHMTTTGMTIGMVTTTGMAVVLAGVDTMPDWH